MSTHGRRPPNPQHAPKAHGRKPAKPVRTSKTGGNRKPPPPVNRSGKSEGCAVMAVALLGVPLGALAALAYGVKEVLS